MSYIARFSVLRSPDETASSIAPITSTLQTDYTNAALTYGAPSAETAKVLNTFIASADFLPDASAGLPNSAKALATQFAAAADKDQAVLLKKLQDLAADPRAAAVERQLSDSLLAAYWSPKIPGWDVRGLIQARKALAVGRLVTGSDSAATSKAAALMAKPVSPALYRAPMRIRPAANTAPSAPARTDPKLAALLQSRSDALGVAALLRSARPTDVQLASHIGASDSAKSRGPNASSSTGIPVLPLTEATKSKLFSTVPEVMKALGYVQSDTIGLLDAFAKVQYLQTSLAGQLAALPLKFPWFIPQNAPGTPTGSTFTSGSPPQTYLANSNLIRIQDFYFIEQVWTGYSRDEISYIENVMPKETFGRLFETTTTTVDSQTDTTETVTEQQQDLSTNTRDDLQRETTQAVSTQASVSAGFQLGYSGGGVTIATDLNASYSTAQQSSTTAAQDFTSQVASDAMQSLKKTVSQQTFHQVTTVTEDKAKHNFINDTTKPIIGIYQYVNKLYDLRTYLYDAKTVIDVVVPEPAALLLEQLGASGSPTTAAAQVPTFDISADDIQRDNFLGFGRQWGVSDLPAAPDYGVTLSKTMTYGSGNADKLDSEVVAGSGQGQDLQTPDGYYVAQVRIQLSVVARDNKRDFGVTGFAGGFYISAGGAVGGESATNWGWTNPGTWEQGSIGLGVTAFNASAYTVVFEVTFAYGDAFRKWQTTVFESLQTGYQKMVDDASNQARLNNVFGPSNLQAPGVATEVIARELKRCVISLLSQQSFDWTGAIDNGPGDPGTRLPSIDFPLAQQQADYIQFFELAFEWPLLQYVAYPYFWGRKAQWSELLKLSNDDPNFLEFLTSGACRVVVPIRQEWADFVETFLSTGQWPTQASLLTPDPNGPVTTPGDQYVTISDQITALKASIPPGGQLLPQTTHVVVPTNMVILSTDTNLPTPPSTTSGVTGSQPAAPQS